MESENMEDATLAERLGRLLLKQKVKGSNPSMHESLYYCYYSNSLVNIETEACFFAIFMDLCRIPDDFAADPTMLDVEKHIRL